MERLDQYIKEWNLVFTNTLSNLDFCRVDFDIDKVEVNYENSASFLDLASSFNKLYLLFKKGYDELEKLDLGEGVEALSFTKFEYNGDQYRSLILYIDKPTIMETGNKFLYLREINGKMKPFITNGNPQFGSGHSRNDIELDEKKSKKYLDFFEKHSLLLDTYNFIKRGWLFGDGTNGLYTFIDGGYDSNLLNGLNNLRIAFGSTSFTTEYFINLLINLGENFGIDYDNSEMIINNQKSKMDKETCDKLFANIYLNKEYTKKWKRY